MCTLFFMIGRVSILWEKNTCETVIQGVTFASNQEIEDFVLQLENYDKKILI